MMRINKKLTIVFLMSAIISQGLSASLPKNPSLLAQACSYVPFKTTLGLGLGLVGVGAYYVYALPKIEKRLRDLNAQKEKFFNPLEILFPNEKKEINILTSMQNSIQDLRALDSKVTFESQRVWEILRDNVQETQKKFAAEFRINSNELSKKSKDDLSEELKKYRRNSNRTYNAYKVACRCSRELAYGIQAYLQSERSENDLYDYRVCLETYNNCSSQILRELKTVKELSDYYTKLERISSYKNWMKSLGLSGISLALIAGISKYFSK